eukprot:COSAG04_NODE_64_length_29689_cov_158.096992_3_plen_168_part_00
MGEIWPKKKSAGCRSIIEGSIALTEPGRALAEAEVGDAAFLCPSLEGDTLLLIREPAQRYVVVSPAEQCHQLINSCGSSNDENRVGAGGCHQNWLMGPASGLLPSGWELSPMPPSSCRRMGEESASSSGSGARMPRCFIQRCSQQRSAVSARNSHSPSRPVAALTGV